MAAGRGGSTMVMTRVDTGAIGAAAAGAGRSADRCAAGVPLALAALAQLGGGAGDVTLASAAADAGRRWGEALSLCAAEARAVAAGADVCRRAYDGAESSAAAAFARSS